MPYKYVKSAAIKRRLIDLREADVPIHKIEQVLKTSEHILRRHYPDVFIGIPDKPGVRPWDPTPEQIRQIEIMAGMGINNKKIALVIGVNETTLQKHCATVIARASVLMDMKVGANIYKMATGNVEHKNTAVMAKFWAQTRMGWAETQRVETTGANGGPIQTQVQIFLPDNGRDDRIQLEAPTIDAEADESVEIDLGVSPEDDVEYVAEDGGDGDNEAED